MAASTDRRATPDEVRRRLENLAKSVTTGDETRQLNASLRRLSGIFDLTAKPDAADGLCEQDITWVHLWTGRMMDEITEANNNGEWVW